MEFSIVVHPSFFPLSEKATSLQTVLNTPASHTPQQWCDLVHNNDHDRNYIVTSLWHYKEPGPLPDSQHEYIVLEVRQRPGLVLSPVPSPTLIKVSRTISNDSFLGRLGLSGPAVDTVEIQPPGTQFTDRCLHQLTWPQNDAPKLCRIAEFIYAIHNAMPQYFLIRTSCYAFARAIKDSVYIYIDGLGRPQASKFLTHESRFLCIPTGTTNAQSVAAGVACMARVLEA